LKGGPTGSLMPTKCCSPLQRCRVPQLPTLRFVERGHDRPIADKGRLALETRDLARRPGCDIPNHWLDLAGDQEAPVWAEKERMNQPYSFSRECGLLLQRGRLPQLYFRLCSFLADCGGGDRFTVRCKGQATDHVAMRFLFCPLPARSHIP